MSSSNSLSVAVQGGFSGQYNSIGVKQYYLLHGETYRNPHERAISKILHEIFSFCEKLRSSEPLSELSFLDLACGSGEVTLSLECFAIPTTSITGFDPFTSKAYFQRTNKQAEPISFEDIAFYNVLEERNFDVVICSFALHLAEPEVLSLLMMNLARSCKVLIILSPTKLPKMKSHYGWGLKEHIVKERIHARIFSSIYFDQ